MKVNYSIIITKIASEHLLFIPHQFIEQYGEKFYNMVTNMYIFLLIMQQYLVPALKDRMKYNRSYDSSKKIARKVEEVTTLDEQPPLKKAKVFKPKDCPKSLAMPVLPLRETRFPLCAT